MLILIKTITFSIRMQSNSLCWLDVEITRKMIAFSPVPQPLVQKIQYLVRSEHPTQGNQVMDIRWMKNSQRGISDTDDLNDIGHFLGGFETSDMLLQPTIKLNVNTLDE